MRAILFVYVVGLFVNLREMDAAAAERAATGTVHLFNAAVYALPLIGAIVSDRLFGKYATILGLSIVYCLGHLALAIFENPAWQYSVLGEVWVDPIHGMYLGLALIALGSGGIKPCVSAHVGDQFGKRNWHLLQKIFNAFYFIINFGSAFATILIPIIRGDLVVDPVTGHYHYEGSVSWAFGVPGILMGLATFAFWLGRKKFVHVPPKPGGVLGLLDVLSGSALAMVLLYPIFFHELTSAPVTIAVSAACFAASMALFALRMKIEPDDGFLATTLYGLLSRVTRRDSGPGEPPAEGRDDLRGHWFYGPAARRFGQEAADGPIAVWRIISIFALVSVFWALFDQHSSTWIAQAQHMDRVIAFDLGGWLAVGAGIGLVVALAVVLAVRKSVIGLALGLVIGLGAGLVAWHFGPSYEIDPSQVPAANPFLVMILIPYTTFGLYPLMRKLGFEPRPLRRITIGMLTAGLSFAAVALIQEALDAGQRVHVAWQLLPYVIITLAEVMVSITGLEFAYSQAPRRMKSVIMSFWMLTIAFGNLIVAFLAGFENLPLSQFFWVFAALMLAAGLVFGLRAAFYTYRDYTQ